MKTILLSYAHPDDESFVSGGTIAKYWKSGWNVVLLCATKGEAGNSSRLNIQSPEQLGQMRIRETEKAAGILGISDIHWLDYKDGGLSALHPGVLEEDIYTYIKAVQPDMVITFEPGGISNHLDHKRVSRSTTYAYQRYVMENDLHEDAKLYYACLPESVGSYLLKTKHLPPISFGKPWHVTEDRFITTTINIRRYRTSKIRALLCHQTQQVDVDRFIFDRNPLLENEYYILRMHGANEVIMSKLDKIGIRL